MTRLNRVWRMAAVLALAGGLAGCVTEQVKPKPLIVTGRKGKTKFIQAPAAPRTDPRQLDEAAPPEQIAPGGRVFRSRGRAAVPAAPRPETPEDTLAPAPLQPAPRPAPSGAGPIIFQRPIDTIAP